MRIDENNLKSLNTAQDLNKENKIHKDFEIKEKEEVFLDEKKIEKLVKKMNGKADNMENSIKFEKAEDMDKWIIKVYNKANGDLVRQIPNEEIIKLTKAMDELIGNILDMKF